MTAAFRLPSVSTWVTEFTAASATSTELTPAEYKNRPTAQRLLKQGADS